MRACALLALLARCGAAAAQPGSASAGLGPGRDEWERVLLPEAVGLDGPALRRAAARLEKVRQRYCFVVIKGGKLVHETYFVNSSDTLYESDSAGKTMIAELVGAVHAAYPFDLDKPIARFGVDTSAFNQFAPNITMRHLLSQTTGVGRVPPGEYFTYDSDTFIQHIAPTLGKIINASAPAPIALQDWADEHFAARLGIPHLFRDNDAYVFPNVSAGGGQHMTCRQLARIGQLIVNEGKWPSAGQGSAPTQLVSAEFMSDLKKQNFPSWGSSYGFLSWLNRPGEAPTFCCAPRWCRGPAFGQPANSLMNGVSDCCTCPPPCLCLRL